MRFEVEQLNPEPVRVPAFWLQHGMELERERRRLAVAVELDGQDHGGVAGPDTDDIRRTPAVVPDFDEADANPLHDDGLAGADLDRVGSLSLAVDDRSRNRRG